MILGEIDIGGVFVPGLLVAALGAGALLLSVRALLGRIGLYAHVWHRNLFDLALYVILLSAIVELVWRATP